MDFVDLQWRREPFSIYEPDRRFPRFYRFDGRQFRLMQNGAVEERVGNGWEYRYNQHLAKNLRVISLSNSSESLDLPAGNDEWYFERGDHPVQYTPPVATNSNKWLCESDSDDVDLYSDETMDTVSY